MMLLAPLSCSSRRREQLIIRRPGGDHREVCTEYGSSSKNWRFGLGSGGVLLVVEWLWVWPAGCDRATTTCARTHARTHVCTHARVRARRQASTQAGTHADMHARRHAGTQARRHAGTQAHKHARRHARTHARKHECMYFWLSWFYLVLVFGLVVLGLVVLVFVGGWVRVVAGFGGMVGLGRVGFAYRLPLGAGGCGLVVGVAFTFWSCSFWLCWFGLVVGVGWRLGFGRWCVWVVFLLLGGWIWVVVGCDWRLVLLGRVGRVCFGCVGVCRWLGLGGGWVLGGGALVLFGGWVWVVVVFAWRLVLLGGFGRVCFGCVGFGWWLALGGGWVRLGVAVGLDHVAFAWWLDLGWGGGVWCVVGVACWRVWPCGWVWVVVGFPWWPQDKQNVQPRKKRSTLDWIPPPTTEGTNRFKPGANVTEGTPRPPQLLRLPLLLLLLLLLQPVK